MNKDYIVNNKIDFEVVSKARKYKVIHYTKNNNKALYLLTRYFGDTILTVNEDNIKLNDEIISDNSYILIPQDDNSPILICDNINDLKEDYYILS